VASTSSRYGTNEFPDVPGPSFLVRGGC
jgi:hypothetical protein